MAVSNVARNCGQSLFIFAIYMYVCIAIEMFEENKIRLYGYLVPPPQKKK